MPNSFLESGLWLGIGCANSFANSFEMFEAAAAKPGEAPWERGREMEQPETDRDTNRTYVHVGGQTCMNSDESDEAGSPNVYQCVASWVHWDFARFWLDLIWFVHLQILQAQPVTTSSSVQLVCCWLSLYHLYAPGLLRRVRGLLQIAGQRRLQMDPMCPGGVGHSYHLPFP